MKKYIYLYQPLSENIISTVMLVLTIIFLVWVVKLVVEKDED